MTIPPDATTVHAPHGFVRLIEFAGSDLAVVNAARVSYDKESEWVKAWEGEAGATLFTHRLRDEWVTLSQADEKLLQYLMKNHHGTPFEHNYFQFHVRAPLFVFREWHRHRIGISINEESARYVALQPDFYLPDDEHCRKQVGKPGHYTYESMTSDEADELRSHLSTSYHKAYDTYLHLMKVGAAKEIARAALPVGIYSQMLWTCNARSLMAFLNLRNAPTAQREIKDYAQAMEDIFFKKMPITAAAFLDCDRIAP